VRRAVPDKENELKGRTLFTPCHPMDPVVSRQNTTSTSGLTAASAFFIPEESSRPVRINPAAKVKIKIFFTILYLPFLYVYSVTR
jgi:hypothetical protein